MLLRRDDLRRIDHRQAAAHLRHLLRLRIGGDGILYQRLRADEDDFHVAVFAERVNRAVYIDLRGEIAAHRIYNNFHLETPSALTFG